MRKLALLSISIIIFISLLSFRDSLRSTNQSTGAPPYSLEDEPPQDLDPLAWIKNWVRPEGPARVGLQAGHWKNNEFPDELDRLRGNTGASGGGKSEWEVNLAIAQKTADLLKLQGIEVDILPATVPPQYWADVFVSIHADGSTSGSTTGFKAASPRRDFTGNASRLVELIEDSYAEATGLDLDPNVTRNMRGYYAFAWWRYKHAIHPMTTAAILETGFLTSPNDRKIIVNKPQLSAQGLFNGIMKYLELQGLARE
jgi:hypothetical protein